MVLNVQLLTDNLNFHQSVRQPGTGKVQVPSTPCVKTSKKSYSPPPPHLTLPEPVFTVYRNLLTVGPAPPSSGAFNQGSLQATQASVGREIRRGTRHIIQQKYASRGRR
ncbi:hypothetical protein PoB_000311000 [Plakobranchus ocellatus]|uniref:Uncharacterized protein n=1 Tax=Plakobranchus ocellatus TaxID=259542 RepID=A0AAV3Y123_9GAST|nr:hypothetical protein PoB_000311000 [Plakobranchus ocellatus]